MKTEEFRERRRAGIKQKRVSENGRRLPQLTRDCSLINNAKGIFKPDCGMLSAWRLCSEGYRD